MACSACGAPMESAARFCVRCGAGVVPPVPRYAAPSPASFRAESRVDRHLQTLGILWLVYGALPLIGWLFALPFVTGALGGLNMMHLHRGWPLTGLGMGLHPGFLGLLIPFVTLVLLVMAAADFLVGFALLRREPWGRGLAIGISIWSIFRPVWGTVLGIYTLWVLMPESSAWEYRKIAA